MRRELDAPPLKAPRSAYPESDAEPRPIGRILDLVSGLKIRGF
jgi:hypothetical protein